MKTSNNIIYSIKNYDVKIGFEPDSLRIICSFINKRTKKILKGNSITLYRFFKDIGIEKLTDVNKLDIYKMYRYYIDKENYIFFNINNFMKDHNIGIEHVQKSFLENL